MGGVANDSNFDGDDDDSNFGFSFGLADDVNLMRTMRFFHLTTFISGANLLVSAEGTEKKRIYVRSILQNHLLLICNVSSSFLVLVHLSVRTSNAWLDIAQLT